MCLLFSRIINMYLSLLFIIPPRWYDTGSWNYFLWKTNSYTATQSTSCGLTQGASATMTLILLNRDNSVLACQELGRPHGSPHLIRLATRKYHVYSSDHFLGFCSSLATLSNRSHLFIKHRLLLDMCDICYYHQLFSLPLCVVNVPMEIGKSMLALFLCIIITSNIIYEHLWTPMSCHMLHV